ncbi:MAG TPA: hypothetical protein VD962_03935 [Rubricoccaceae bacterium]|nr:hypothetical protein [Rubricoccaceae bacterium]
MPLRVRPFSLTLLLPLLAVAGCDTDSPGSTLDELEGVYAITELYFDPEASGIQDADVAARLDSARTYVELIGSGRVLVRFRFTDESAGDLADADYTATRTTARITARTELDAEIFDRLLLPQSFTLSRVSDDELSGAFSTTADLDAYDPELYAGLTAVPGTLNIRLERED